MVLQVRVWGWIHQIKCIDKILSWEWGEVLSIVHTSSTTSSEMFKVWTLGGGVRAFVDCVCIYAILSAKSMF